VINKNLIVVDYGMGNIWSVLSALHYLGAVPQVSNDPDKVLKADLIILPGVGSFRKAMETLKSSGLDQAMIEAVKSGGVKILGICLGMQLLGSHGTEDGEIDGLGLINNKVDKFTEKELGRNKIPHIGFNSVSLSDKKGLFQNLPDNPDFYFVHSYRLLPEELAGRTAICSYGIDFLAAFEVDNICGTQFHPEKSQTNGLILLKNFLQ
jgi:glutamine amidotransferase